MNSQIYQTNAFIKGMNMDVDISMLPSDQYRYAENVRLLSNDGGTTGVLQGVENIEKLATSYFGANEIIIGTATIREYGMVITKDYTDSTCYNRFWRFDFSNNIKVPVVTCILEGIFNIDNRLSIVTNYSSPTDIKIYFADGVNMIRSLNILNTITNPSFNIGALDAIPNAVLPPFDNVGLGSGSLPSGTIQYCYQLFNLYSSETSTSGLSVMLPLSSATASSLYPYGQAINNNSNKSVKLKVDIQNIGVFNKCRVISIHYASNTTLPIISIVNEINIGVDDTVIYYEDKGNNYLSELTVEEFNALTGSQFAPKSIAKMDNKLFASNIQDLTWDIDYDARAYRAKLSGTVLLNSASSDSISFTFPNLNANTVPITYDCINPTNDLSVSEIPYDSNYIYNRNGYKGGSGLNIEYKLITTDLCVEKTTNNVGAGYIVTADADPTGYKSIEKTYFSAPIVTDNNLTITASDSTTTIEKVIPLAGATYSGKKNYSDPLIADKYKSYQRDEVYRFGIMFYNDKNVVSPVHWIGDIRMPHAKDELFFSATYYRNTTTGDQTNYTYVHPMGIQFTVNNLPSSVKAFEIVRCKRSASDRTVLMQGVISNLVNYLPRYSDSITTDIRPYPFLTYSDLLRVTGCDTSDSYIHSPLTRRYYNFVSPEVCYDKSNIAALLNNENVSLDTICGLASTIDRNNSGTYVASVFCIPRLIRTKDNALLDITADVDYKTSGQVADDGKVFMPSNGHGVMIAKYFMPFFTAREYGETTFISLSGLNLSIDNVEYVEPLLWSDSDSANILAKGTSIGDKTYHNWSYNCQANPSEEDSKNPNLKYGPHGYCLVFKSTALNNAVEGFAQIGESTANANLIIYNTKLASNAVYLSNIKQKVTQYGGNTYTAIQNSVYISIGCYKLRVSEVSSDTINCFGGDTFIGILDYSTTMMFSAADPTTNYSHKIYTGAYIPFESSINFAFKTNESYMDTAAVNNQFLQNKAGEFLTYFSQKLDPYTYNDAYSSQPGSRQFVSKSIYDISNELDSNRITCSLNKSGVDVIDQWTKFKFADYIDVDNQYGAITNLKVYNNKLYYWQEDSFGIAAVNERSLVQDNNIGQLVLGTGDVLARYDYISTNFGNSIVNDKSIVRSDSTIYWYDFNNNELVAFGNDIHSLSKVKSVQTFFNELPEIKRDNVLSYYDKKYNEIVFKVYDKSLVFNEQLQEFTCFYTIDPEWMLTFSNRFYSISNNQVYLHNTTDNLSEQTYPAYTLDDGSYADINISKIQFVVNKDLEYTKTFDNVFFNGDLIVPTSELVTDTNVMKDVWFKTKNQETIPILQADIDNREDTYRFAIGREKNDNAVNNIYNNSFLGRMKGKYLICNYSFDCRQGKSFRIPSIRTTYRYSLV